MVGGGGINLSVIPGIFWVLICAPVVFLWCSALFFSMEFEKIEMDVTADDYEALKSFCRIYHIPENDGLSAALVYYGVPVKFNLRSLKFRWKIFFWGMVVRVKGIFNSESEDVVFLREWRYLNMVSPEKREGDE